jgi:hypothetical protein
MKQDQAVVEESAAAKRARIIERKRGSGLPVSVFTGSDWFRSLPMRLNLSSFSAQTPPDDRDQKAVWSRGDGLRHDGDVAQLLLDFAVNFESRPVETKDLPAGTDADSW